MWSRRMIDQLVWGAEGESCGAGEGSGGLWSRRRIMWSRRRIMWSRRRIMWSRRKIRWSGEQEEDYVEQEEDQVVWRAGEGS